MERGAWTEERLDDLAIGMRDGFARLDQDNRDLRADMNDGFKQLRGEISELRGETSEVRGELHGEIGALRVEMSEAFRALHTLLLRIGGGIIVGLIGVIAAILARGV
jgi:hypothetical protein